MFILGVMLLVVGLILLATARGIYKGGKNSVGEFKDMPGDNDAFLSLLSNGMIVMRLIGGLLIVAGIVFMII